MSLSMYEASIPVFSHFLSNLSLILDKAARYVTEKNIDEAVIVTARLAPDMFPLSRQIQVMSDITKGCAARLADIEVPVFADDEASLHDLQARITKTLQFIQKIQASTIDGSELREITLKIGGKELSFKGQAYLLNFVLPNLGRLT